MEAVISQEQEVKQMVRQDEVATRKMRVILVDDHPIVRQGLTQLLQHDPDLAVVGEAESPVEALKVIDDLKPDIALVDITLKDASGIELVKDIRVRHPQLPVLVLSMHDESFYAERVLRAGARGYVTKEEAPEKVLNAIKRVLAGEIYVSEKMASRMLSKLVDGRPGTEGFSLERLTDRELEVFELIGQGVGTRNIAKKLHLSVKTIESHRENIKRKLKLKNAAELLQHAIQWVQVEKTS
jgi:DNA-binding NarL/FixJ family response regulator